MKKNKKTPKKIKKAEAVRQAIAAEQARKKAAEKAAAKAARKPMHSTKKTLFALVATAAAFAIATITIGAIWLQDPVQKTVWSAEDLAGLSVTSVKTEYELANMRRLFKMNRDDYTGKTVSYTKLDTDAYMKNLLYGNRKPAAEGSPLEVGIGDDLSIYILGLTDESGKEWFSDYFAQVDYTSPTTFTVGYNEFGDAFDKAVSGSTLNDSYLIRHTIAAPTQDSVVAMGYVTYLGTYEEDKDGNVLTNDDGTPKIKWGTSYDTSLSSQGYERVELSTMDAAQKEALLAAFKAYGQEFVYEYELTREVEKDGETTTETLPAKVHAVISFTAEERIQEATFVMDKNFSSNSLSAFASLDGKTVTLRFIISGIGNYEEPTWTADLIKNTLGFETDLTEDSAVYEAFRKHTEDEYNKKQAIAQVYATVADLMDGKNDGNNTSLNPTQELYDLEYQNTYQSMVNAFVSAYGEEPADISELDSYVATYCRQMGYSSITTTAAYCQAKAQGDAIQKMIMTYIFENERTLTVTDADLEEAYKAYIAQLTETYGNKEGIDEVYFVRKYGKESLMQTVRSNLIYNLVGEFLLANNTVS